MNEVTAVLVSAKLTNIRRTLLFSYRHRHRSVVSTTETPVVSVEIGQAGEQEHYRSLKCNDWTPTSISGGQQQH